MGKGLGAPTKPLNDGCQLAPGEAQRCRGRSGGSTEEGEAGGALCWESWAHMFTERALGAQCCPGKKKALKRGGGR